MITITLAALASAYPLAAGTFLPILVAGLGHQLVSVQQQIEEETGRAANRRLKNRAAKLLSKLGKAHGQIYFREQRMLVKQGQVATRDLRIKQQNDQLRQLEMCYLAQTAENLTLRRKVAEHQSSQHATSRSLSRKNSADSGLFMPYVSPPSSPVVATVSVEIKTTEPLRSWKLDELCQQAEFDRQARRKVAGSGMKSQSRFMSLLAGRYVLGK